MGRDGRQVDKDTADQADWARSFEKYWSTADIYQ